MAKIINEENPMMNGTSGSIGNLTFMTRNGQTISWPKRGPNKKPPTEEQVAVQVKFERFAAYAQEAIADPEKKLLYAKAAKKGQSAFNAAFRDAARPPRVSEIDTRQYRGLVGGVIRFLVKDVVRVESVKVKILSEAGAELEQGDAVSGIGNYWKYTATVANPAMLGSRVLVTATDLPGNITEAEFEI
ncbi:hypothetical protein [Chitinophaga ginsengisoli]|uniref:Uncharacterized protein n=1 Tax=Chitinophaga ginsengisoli TaxID=363837 RepID=A0A2P8G9Q9_9BACT|nr:hypothetical protein [Chitinophaga ginsengisoli]PSL30709.1 hypothetical protein CLV42_10570 [Chitinophaga ginsengisoli]